MLPVIIIPHTISFDTNDFRIKRNSIAFDFDQSNEDRISLFGLFKGAELVFA